ncbi:TonB-dependent receptor domain-containing protein [Rhodosalinus sp. K401]|uniref:TonB-dependent receptor domain-containing protein n=1 Tax=Rhodosalinus sp. K401 TaxID=3239195 RepID=UPI00352493BF
MRTGKVRLLWGAAATALAAGLGGQVSAQETEGGFTPLGRLVLGAGTEKVAIDTPQAVTVLEQEDIDREQATTVGELFDTVPGVETGGSGRLLGEAFNIRGIGNTEQTASQSRIIVTVDGAPKFFEQYRTGSFFGDPALYKRVEILRGPASSTLYGSGAIGGVINFTTKDASDFLAPGETGALRFRAGYGSNGNAWRGGLIYAARPDENAELLFALNRGTSDDVEDGDGTTLDGTAYERWSGLVKGTFHFGQNDDQSLRLSWSRTDGDLADTVVAQTGGPAVAGFGTADIRSLDDTVTLSWDHQGAGNPWLDLDVTLSWSNTEVEKRDFSAGFLCAPGIFLVLCDNDAAYETLSLKAENTIEFGSGAWENYLTFGTQLSQQERTASSSLGALPFHPQGTDSRAAIYAQGEFIWNDRLTLIPGVRLEKAFQDPGAAAEAAGARATEELAVSPKLAVMYELNDAWSVFGSLARTERLPTLDELYSSEGEVQRGPLFFGPRTPSLNLDPEIATTVEIGLAYEGFDVLSEGDSLQLKATAFNNSIRDLIASTPRATGPTPGQAAVPYFSNIDSARIWGLELEGAYDAEGWFANAAYSLVRSEDESTGETLTDTPADTLSLTLGTRLPERDLRLGWRGNWANSITTASAETNGDSYVTHDLFLDWTPDSGPLEGMTVNLAVENVTDATYRPNLQLDNAPGRTFKIALTKEFDW